MCINPSTGLNWPHSRIFKKRKENTGRYNGRWLNKYQTKRLKRHSKRSLIKDKQTISIDA